MPQMLDSGTSWLPVPSYFPIPHRSEQTNCLLIRMVFNRRALIPSSYASKPKHIPLIGPIDVIQDART